MILVENTNKAMKINASNFYNRNVKRLPKHFHKVACKPHVQDTSEIKKWIYENCAGRYFVDHLPDWDSYKTKLVVGFEKQEELTFFLLSGVAQIEN